MQKLNRMKARQGGVAILVVLVLLSVMLLGGLAFARMTEVSTLANGNSAYRDAALQASEVGINEAFAAVRTLVGENTASGAWYRPTQVAVDAHGLPVVDWSAMPTFNVGQNDRFKVSYFVERICSVAAVTKPLRECLVKFEDPVSTAEVGAEKIDPPNSKQFRVTVRVIGPKGTESWVQSLITRGL